MGRFYDWLENLRSKRDLRYMDRYNLKEANSMGNDCLEDDTWLYGLVWDEKRGKYKRSKNAFSDGLKKLENKNKEDDE